MGNVLQNGWWWLLDYAYAGIWQVRAALSRTDPINFLGGTGAPVVIVPGVYETWQFMRPVIEALRATPPTSSPPTSRNVTSPEPSSSLTARAA
jgi:hypothetical protein